MRPAWSSFLALVAAAAALDAHIAAAGTTESRHAIAFSTQDFLLRASILDGMADRSAQVLAPVRQWIGESYARAPALVLGLSVVMVVPPLALVGLLARRKRRTSAAPSPDTTLALTRAGKRGAALLEPNTLKTEGFSWPTEAWVDIQGTPGGRYVIGRTLVRIGREADNDIRLSAKTVHRYHAAIRRTTDGDVMVTDLSGNEGNGVLVNGKPVDEARLKKGDIINVGEVKLHFDAKPV